MADKKILVDYDFIGNQIVNGRLHVAAVAPTAYGEGQVYYDSALDRIRWYDGAAWNDIFTIDDAGATVNDLWSAVQIQAAIDSAVAGGVNYQGGYDAATNSPQLDAAPIAISKGYMYTVTVAGLFFTEQVEIGDVLIAEIDSAAALGDWTIVERNQNTATDSSEGVVELATLGEAEAGTTGALVITADILNQWVASKNVAQGYSTLLDGTLTDVTRTFTGSTRFQVDHNLATTDVIIRVKEVATNETVVTEDTDNGINSTFIDFNGNIANGEYYVTIIGH